MRASGEPLRPDDNPEVLKKRLAAYRAQTAPLVAYYQARASCAPWTAWPPSRRSRSRSAGRWRMPPFGSPQKRRLPRPQQGSPRPPRSKRRKPARQSRVQSGPPRPEQGPRQGARRPSGRKPGKRPQDATKARGKARLAEVDEVRWNPLITCTFSRTSSNDAGPGAGGGRRVIACKVLAGLSDSTPRHFAGGNRSEVVARIAGVNIPTNKRVVIALQYIHGIGQTNAKDIMEKVRHSDGAPRVAADRPGSAADPRNDRPRLSSSKAICAAKCR